MPAQHDGGPVLRPLLCLGVLLSPVVVPLGSTLAAAGQVGYDPLRQTLSTLSRAGAPDRWIMTSVLVGVGACYLVGALALAGTPAWGRLVLAVGGAGTVLTGLLPQPFVGSSPWHMGAATVAWIAFTLWPLAACPRPAVPGLPGPRAAWATTAVLVVLVGWFVVELRTGGPYLGLSERVLISAQTVWPALVVAVVLRRSRVRAGASASRTTADPDERRRVDPTGRIR